MFIGEPGGSNRSRVSNRSRGVWHCCRMDGGNRGNTVVSIVRTSHSDSVSCVPVGNQLSQWLSIASGVRLPGLCGCTRRLCDWYGLASREVSWKTNEWRHFRSTVIYRSWLCGWCVLIAGLLELIVPVLGVFQKQATPLGLEVNWQKTMVQALGSMRDEHCSLLVCGMMSNTWMSLSTWGPWSIRHAAVNQTSVDAVPWIELQRLDRHLCRSRITTRTRRRLYDAYILSILLYGSGCWTANKADMLRIDALGHWCLRRILNIRWHDFVRNDDIRRLTEQPPLSFVVKRRLLVAKIRRLGLVELQEGLGLGLDSDQNPNVLVSSRSRKLWSRLHPWLNPVHAGNNVEATLSNATKSNVASTKSNVASTSLLVWTGLVLKGKEWMKDGWWKKFSALGGRAPILTCHNCSLSLSSQSPSPPTDNIWAMVIVWRVRGEIIWPALCFCAS